MDVLGFVYLVLSLIEYQFIIYHHHVIEFLDFHGISTLILSNFLDVLDSPLPTCEHII